MARTAAARRLLNDMDKALALASREIGQPMEWSEKEVKTLELLGQTVDRAEGLRKVFEVERRGDASPAVLVKISAELRALDRQITTFMALISADLGPAKSSRHQRAADARWRRVAGGA